MVNGLPGYYDDYRYGIPGCCLLLVIIRCAGLIQPIFCGADSRFFPSRRLHYYLRIGSLPPGYLQRLLFNFASALRAMRALKKNITKVLDYLFVYSTYVCPCIR